MNIVYKINGQQVTQRRFRRKRMLHGGIAEIVASRRSADLQTDTAMIARHTAMTPEHERRQIAMRAKQVGLCEEQAYDPTLANSVLDPAAMFESRAQKKKRASEWSQDREEYHRVKHRLHPRIVQEIKEKMAEKDPDVLRRDQNELEHEIIERHGSKG